MQATYVLFKIKPESGMKKPTFGDASTFTTKHLFVDLQPQGHKVLYCRRYHDLWRILYGRDILCLQTWIVKYIFEVGFPRSNPSSMAWFSGCFVNLASARRGGPSLSHGWFQGNSAGDFPTPYSWITRLMRLRFSNWSVLCGCKWSAYLHQFFPKNPKSCRKR